MKKPDFVHCWDCQHWYWYAGLCTTYSDNEELGIDHMCPESIEDCELFEIKTQQELGYESYDTLPDIETVEKVREVRMKIFDDLISRINGGDRT